jgi:hypothetical protein
MENTVIGTLLTKANPKVVTPINTMSFPFSLKAAYNPSNGGID